MTYYQNKKTIDSIIMQLVCVCARECAPGCVPVCAYMNAQAYIYEWL